MHQYGMSTKSAQKHHINCTSISAATHYEENFTPKNDGFVIIMADETFFVRDVKKGKNTGQKLPREFFHTQGIMKA